MSTVDQNTADRVIAGDFPEDNIYAILRYENIFNEDYAYELMYSPFGFKFPEDSERLAYAVLETAMRICAGAPVKLYWCIPELKPILSEILVNSIVEMPE